MEAGGEKSLNEITSTWVQVAAMLSHAETKGSKPVQNHQRQGTMGSSLVGKELEEISFQMAFDPNLSTQEHSETRATP